MKKTNIIMLNTVLVTNRTESIIGIELEAEDVGTSHKERRSAKVIISQTIKDNPLLVKNRRIIAEKSKSALEKAGMPIDEKDMTNMIRNEINRHSKENGTSVKYENYKGTYFDNLF